MSPDEYCSAAAALGEFPALKAIRPLACGGVTGTDQNAADYPNVPGTPGFSPIAAAAPSLAGSISSNDDG
jgi:hypothetical protein